MLPHRTRLGLVTLLVGLGAADARAAPPEDDLPVREITLYRAGVGYFEHAAEITGDRTFRLRFPSHALDDILKSMTLLDLGEGTIGPVRYGSKDPLERRLANFGVDISKAPGTIELFGQLRGSELRVRTSGDVIEGTILGVEERNVGQTAVKQSHVTLLTKTGVRAVHVASIVAFELMDEGLAEELDLALRALAEQRSERMKTVELAFLGPEATPRTVVVSYVQEVPVWKTSYRLLLPDEAGDKATMQGFAIVENTTGEEWRDVRLSLAAGDPISFTMDLDQPIFADRPNMPIPLPEGLSPVIYQAGTDSGNADRKQAYRQGGELASRAAAGDPAAIARLKEIQSELAAVAVGEVPKDQYTVEAEALGDAQATGAEVGGEFHYTVDSRVTLGRQSSAMLPILLAPITARRVSIFGPEVENRIRESSVTRRRAALVQELSALTRHEAGRVPAVRVDAYDAPEHPIKGIELINDSETPWLPGPIAVFDGGSFAGDSQVDDVVPGQTRLIGYARDTAVVVRSRGSAARTLVQVRIAGGRIEQSMKERQAREYSLHNHDDTRARTIILEHRKKEGWDLVEPGPPSDETEKNYRFEVRVPAGGAASLVVAQEEVKSTYLSVGNLPIESGVAWQSRGLATRAFVDALRKAEELRGVVDQATERVLASEQEHEAIDAEQERIRANLPHLDAKSDLARRYLTKLAAQETRLEELAARRKESIQAREAAQAAYDAFLRGLDVR